MQNNESKTTASAYWITELQQGELRQTTVPSPQPNEVLVKTLLSAISRGTESLVFNASVPLSEHKRMQAPFQAGEFTFPIKYGYCNVGVVEDGPSELIGQKVFCLYPHQDRYVVPVDAVYRIPDGVPAKRAILAANMETAVNALWDASPQIGDTISVIGAGVVGMLIAWLATSVRGCKVELIDILPNRENIAKDLGIPFALAGKAASPRDLLFHTSASESGLHCTLSLAGFESTIVEVSWYGDKSIVFPAGADFHAKRLTYQSSQVGHIATTQRSRWDYKRRLALVMDLLAAPELDVLINSESHFQDIEKNYPSLMQANQNTLCHCIYYT